jgi:mRNA interferase MazF
MELNQYEIVLVNLDPTIRSEIKKTRPCVIISPIEMNDHLQTIIIAPMTTAGKNYPTRVEVEHNNIRGWLVLDQIITIDKRRIINKFDKLAAKEINQTKSVLKEMLVD